MADVKIILPDGSAKEYAAGTTLGEAVKQLSNSLAKKVLAANVNGELTDLREELVDGSEVAFLTFEEDGGKHTLRHTASHILAQAVKRLWLKLNWLSVLLSIKVSTMISIWNIL